MQRVESGFVIYLRVGTPSQLNRGVEAALARRVPEEGTYFSQ